MAIPNDINFLLFVIPGLTKPAPYLIRGNPAGAVREPPLHPAFAGMTCPVPINVVMYRTVSSIGQLPSQISFRQMRGTVLFVKERISSCKTNGLANKKMEELPLIAVY